MTRVALSWAVVLSLLVSAAALGQPFPNRPIRMVVPFEAGGSMDAVGRAFVDPWAGNLKQRIVIDNRGGAGGTVGTTIVAQAPPDGHTVLYANLGPLSIGPSLYRKLGYDLFKDLAPVSLVGSSPIVIFVSTSLPVQSVKDFVAYAKAKPGQLNYATSGIGSGLHLTGELFKSVAGIDMVHVPYKGVAQAAADIASGRIQVLVNTYSGTIPHLKAGRLRPVITGGASAQHAHARRAHRRGGRLPRFSEHCMARGGRACRNTQGCDLAASSDARRRARHPRGTREARGSGRRADRQHPGRARPLSPRRVCRSGTR